MGRPHGYIMDPFFTREKFIVRNGSQTRFWEDLWIGKDSLIMKQYPLLYNSDRGKKSNCSRCAMHKAQVHYRKPPDCRVPKRLPCAQTRAHGKPVLCRVPADTAHAIVRHTAKVMFAVCRGKKTHGKSKTHGKRRGLPCAEKDLAHGKEALFAVCLIFLHTANILHTAKL